ncbi:thiamine pyrophosphokinase [Holotrichia oblita]|uniref:Thiamine pyrophosphokinase n=1 Tax=Holotrichia oblita TaxID=644536 RepID=A0ACB9SWN4_HOLOL|nr:thiamine pyrophosphokinase [Holotrichia oblita]
MMTVSKTWDPCAILQAKGVDYNYAILVLNRRITDSISKDKLLSLWQNATVRITVDGGTDHWLLWLEQNNVPKDIIKQPDLITGDMDSIEPETLKHFNNVKTCTVKLTEDQTETDYTKALKELKKYVKYHNMQIDYVITLSDDSGRFDQIIANVNTLFKAVNFMPNVDIFILTREALSWLLWTGSHKILVPPTALEYSKWCSLIPFGSKAHVTTMGLKWDMSTVRITVDGGTDHWLLWLEQNNVPKDIIKQPDLITGDMDSIEPETLKHFNNVKTCTVKLTEDQTETDYTKALKELKKYVKYHNMQIDYVITLSDDSGRFDQIIANVNTLFKAVNFMPNVDIFILTREALSWLLWTGSHKILVPPTALEYSKWCSLIPFGSKAHVTTMGLKWDMSNTVLAYGQLISTSNSFTNSPEITVTTDSPLVWSMVLFSEEANKELAKA